MGTLKKKIIKDSKADSKKNKQCNLNDKCPKEVKNCLECDIINCPEEVTY
jgi:hypothetical protein